MRPENEIRKYIEDLTELQHKVIKITGAISHTYKTMEMIKDYLKWSLGEDRPQVTMLVALIEALVEAAKESNTTPYDPKSN